MFYWNDTLKISQWEHPAVGAEVAEEESALEPAV
jgi:hypothetical protein